MDDSPNLIRRWTLALSASLGLGLPVLSVPASLMAVAVPRSEPLLPGWEMIMFVIAAGLLLGSGFLLFAISHADRYSNPRYQVVTCILLLFPLAGGCVLAATSHLQLFPMALAFALIFFTVWLQLLCIRPFVKFR